MTREPLEELRRGLLAATSERELRDLEYRAEQLVARLDGDAAARLLLDDIRAARRRELAEREWSFLPDAAPRRLRRRSWPIVLAALLALMLLALAGLRLAGIIGGAPDPEPPAPERIVDTDLVQRRLDDRLRRAAGAREVWLVDQIGIGLDTGRVNVRIKPRDAGSRRPPDEAWIRAQVRAVLDDMGQADVGVGQIDVLAPPRRDSADDDGLGPAATAAWRDDLVAAMNRRMAERRDEIGAVWVVAEATIDAETKMVHLAVQPRDVERAGNPPISRFRETLHAAFQDVGARGHRTGNIEYRPGPAPPP